MTEDQLRQANKTKEMVLQSKYLNLFNKKGLIHLDTLVSEWIAEWTVREYPDYTESNARHRREYVLYTIGPNFIISFKNDSYIFRNDEHHALCEKEFNLMFNEGISNKLFNVQLDGHYYCTNKSLAIENYHYIVWEHGQVTANSTLSLVWFEPGSERFIYKRNKREDSTKSN